MTSLKPTVLLILIAISAFPIIDRSSNYGDVKPVHSPIVLDGPDNAQFLARLRSEEIGKRREAYQKLLREHQQLTQGLIEIAEQELKADEKGFLSKRELAIKILAEFGCRDAIPMFIKHIDYRQQMNVSEASFLNGYPCALALRRIGHSSVPYIIRYLQVPEPDPVVTQQRIVDGLPPIEVRDKQIELFAWLFLELYGQNEGGHQEAIRVVRGARDRAFHKENVTRLLTMLETLTDPKKSSEFIKKNYRQTGTENRVKKGNKSNSN